MHPALVMASVYLYQFPFISGNLGFLSPATWQYIGLPSVSDDMTIAQLLWTGGPGVGFEAPATSVTAQWRVEGAGSRHWSDLWRSVILFHKKNC